MNLNPAAKYVHENYQIIDNDLNYYYKVIIDKKYYTILIIGNKGLMIWPQMSSFNFTNKQYNQRLVDNYRLCSILNLGPKLYQSIDIEDYTILIMEYLPYQATEELVNNYPDTFKSFVANMHNLGIFHGDLHTGNFRLKNN